MKRIQSIWKTPLFKHARITITIGDTLFASISVLLLVVAWIHYDTIQQTIEEIVSGDSPKTITIGEEEWEDVEDLIITMDEEMLEEEIQEKYQNEEQIEAYKKEWMENENVCLFVERNVKDVYTLLKRADICSKDWFEEYQTYRTRLQEQNRLLKGQTSKNHKQARVLQKEIVKAMEDFYQTQDNENLEKVEKAIEAYATFSNTLCRGEIAYE